MQFLVPGSLNVVIHYKAEMFFLISLCVVSVAGIACISIVVLFLFVMLANVILL